MTFDPEILIGHCDLISWSSDFASYLDTQLIYLDTSISERRVSMTRAHCGLISWFSNFALNVNTHWVYHHTSFIL